MELLPAALIPFVEKRLESSLKGHWQVQVLEKLPNLRPNSSGEVGWDQAALFNAMDRFWSEAFKAVLGRAERSLVNELGDVRNKLSHNETFTYDDAERALDSMRRLMEAISAGETAEQLGKMRDTILRTKFTELARNEERRKTQRLEISVETVAGLSAAHLGALLIPPGVRRLYLALDADGAGREGTRRLAERARQAGIEALTLRSALGDFNDDLRHPFSDPREGDQQGVGTERVRLGLLRQLAPGDAARFVS